MFFTVANPSEQKPNKSQGPVFPRVCHSRNSVKDIRMAFRYPFSNRRWILQFWWIFHYLLCFV